MTLEEIATTHNMELEFLKNLHYHESWDELKTVYMNPKKAIMNHLANDLQARTITRAAELSIELLATYLKQIAEQTAIGLKITNNQANTIKEIFVQLDKVKRLDDDRPTDHIKLAGVTMDEARKILKNDPFLDDVEASYKELDEIIKEENNADKTK